MKSAQIAGILLIAGTVARAHRLDEYLQSTLLSVKNSRVEVQMTLTPGVAVSSFLIASIDRDRDGAISETEQRAYAQRVLQDVTMTVDGHRLTPSFRSIRFPATSEMKEGRGGIEFAFDADLPRGGGNRKLTFRNRHETGISAYQVNVLVPQDPRIRIAAQRRDYLQSNYELDYLQIDGQPEQPLGSFHLENFESLGIIALFGFALLVFLARKRGSLAFQNRANTAPNLDRL